MTKFWNWADENALFLQGPIAEESWYGDEITPSAFREELGTHSGDITVWLNSPGGDVFAASQIYTMLRDHKGKVTVKIDAVAASAASVVAMAGDEVLISPTGMMMIHNPATVASGDRADMEKAIALLDEVKESIINAYAEKSHLTRAKISKLMDDETWLNAGKAVQWGLADGILFAEKEPMPADIPEEDDPKENIPIEEKSLSAVAFSPMKQTRAFMQKVANEDTKPTGVPLSQLTRRLELLKWRT